MAEHVVDPEAYFPYLYKVVSTYEMNDIAENPIKITRLVGVPSEVELSQEEVFQAAYDIDYEGALTAAEGSRGIIVEPLRQEIIKVVTRA